MPTVYNNPLKYEKIFIFISHFYCYRQKVLLKTKISINKFYGQIRTDFYYNSRANEETVDGLFYMYPKDKVYDQQVKT